MSTNYSKLKSNVRAIGSIFFSGSQTVTKGDEVIWILDDTWAFQATEDCKVSTNASPFVELKAGSTFIIYKRTQADIDEGNTKGIYIFDRDTVVGLAYPQDVTQDIVIQNDMYNNNYSSVTIEADKTPTAKINASNSKPYVGTSITISGSASYAVAPAHIASYRWTKNGAVVSNSSQFSYKTTRVGQDDITLVITDSDGRKNNTSMGIVVAQIPEKPPVTPPDVTPPVIPPKPASWTQTYSQQASYLLRVANQWHEIGRLTVGKSGSGTIKVKASTPLRVYTNGNSYKTIKIKLRNTRTGAENVTEYYIGNKRNYTTVVLALSATFANQTSESSDVWVFSITNTATINYSTDSYKSANGHSQIQISLNK